MSRDPIVDEIHRVRDKMMEEAGGNPKKLFELIRRKGAVPPERLVATVEREEEKETPVG